MYFLDKLFSFKIDSNAFPKGLCVFDLDFTTGYQTKVLTAKDKSAQFQSIVKDYTKRLRAKPKVLVFLLEAQGRQFVAMVNKIWLEETEYSEEIKQFKDMPCVLVLDPYREMTSDIESLLQK